MAVKKKPNPKPNLLLKSIEKSPGNIQKQTHKQVFFWGGAADFFGGYRVPNSLFFPEMEACSRAAPLRIVYRDDLENSRLPLQSAVRLVRLTRFRLRW